jgi:putative phage-type endonuclease
MHFEDRDSWLAGRQNGLGASDAAAVVGLSPWMTALALWKQKLGMEAAPDLSGNAAAQDGVKMEPVLRDYYIATHPQYTLEYYPYDILSQTEKPFITATLDGELCDADGRKGILEIKNVSISNKTALEKWTGGKIPEYYYVQIIAQLAATGFQFARLFAALHFMNGDTTLKEFEVERDEVIDDIEWLTERMTAFWEQNIIGGTMPPQPLIL